MYAPPVRRPPPRPYGVRQDCAGDRIGRARSCTRRPQGSGVLIRPATTARSRERWRGRPLDRVHRRQYTRGRPRNLSNPHEGASPSASCIHRKEVPALPSTWDGRATSFRCAAFLPVAYRPIGTALHPVHEMESCGRGRRRNIRTESNVLAHVAPETATSTTAATDEVGASFWYLAAYPTRA
jgi:hypothetical protein